MAHTQIRCSICTSAQVNAIDTDRLVNKFTYAQLIAKYFPGANVSTKQNVLGNHFKKHRNVAQAAIQTALVVPPAPSSLAGGNPAQRLTVSTQRVFNKAVLEHLNASVNLEKMMLMLMEKINILEDEFFHTHFDAKCDACGRSADQGQNLSKVLACIREVRELNTEWVKIRNPKDVIKQQFNASFISFVDRMTAFYMEILQEKGRLIRLATNDFIEGRIGKELFSRRIAEVEDMDARTVGDKSIMELRRILEEVGKQLDKGVYA